MFFKKRKGDMCYKNVQKMPKFKTHHPKIGNMS